MLVRNSEAVDVGIINCRGLTGKLYQRRSIEPAGTCGFFVNKPGITSPCSQVDPLAWTVSDKAIPKSTLSQHFRALREAGLIRGERRGVEMHKISRYAEIEERFPGLLRAIVNAHTIQSNDEAQAKKRVAERSSRRLVKNK